MDKEIRMKLKNLLEDLHPDIDFEQEKKLIEDGILDSFDVVELVSELNYEFKIRIIATYIIPKYFNDIDGMVSLISELSSGGNK